MKRKTKIGLAVGIFGVPLAVVWLDLLLNVFNGPGYLKLGYWWF